MTTLAELFAPRSADAITAEQLAALAAALFPVDSWASGSAARLLVRADATSLARVEATVAQIAKGAYGPTATGDWLDLFAESRFNLTRIAATYAAGEVVLTVASGAGPFAVAAGGLLVSDGALRWRSTNTGTVNITGGSPTTFTVRAELAGVGGNASNNTITRILSPALPGVTCNNPVIGSTSTWLSASAIDREGDGALLARCLARWATLGSGFTRDACAYWARSAETSPGVNAGATRVSFAAPGADGTYTVYVAGASGVLAGPAVAAIQTEINKRKPITDTPTVVAAKSATITCTGTVRFKSASTAGERSAIIDAIKAYINALDMPDDGETVVVDLAGIYAAIYSGAPGRIADADLSSPSTDTNVSLGSVAVADTAGLTFT